MIYGLKKIEKVSARISERIKWTVISAILSSFVGKVTAFMSLFITIAPVIDIAETLGLQNLAASFYPKVMGAILFLIGYVVFLGRCPGVIREHSIRENFNETTFSKIEIEEFFSTCCVYDHFSGKLRDSISDDEIKATYWVTIDKHGSHYKTVILFVLIFSFMLFYCREILWGGEFLKGWVLG